ncbi:MAG: universal stress protein [Anaerolineae bacterium]
MFKSIVIAIDSSDSANKALHLGADLARFCGSKVTLVHAAGPSDAMAPADAALFGEPPIAYYSGDELEESQNLLQTAAETISDLHPDTKTLDVPASGHISDFAKSIGADLIVIGRHHHGFLGDMFGHGLSRSLLDHSDIPVLVAK